MGGKPSMRLSTPQNHLGQDTHEAALPSPQNRAATLPLLWHSQSWHTKLGILGCAMGHSPAPAGPSHLSNEDNWDLWGFSQQSSSQLAHLCQEHSPHDAVSCCLKEHILSGCSGDTEGAGGAFATQLRRKAALQE